MYSGPAQSALGYFASRGHQCPPLTNPAEFFRTFFSFPDSKQQPSKTGVSGVLTVELLQGDISALIQSAPTDKLVKRIKSVVPHSVEVGVPLSPFARPLAIIEEDKWGDRQVVVCDKRVQEDIVVVQDRRATWCEEWRALCYRSWLSFYRTPLLLVSKCLQMCMSPFCMSFPLQPD